MSEGPRTATGESLEPGRPVVFRNGLVITMNDAGDILTDVDVLIVDGTIAAVGPHLEAPADALEIDAKNGIIMPGMIDTHRHMWQTAMRGYGADWSLSQYFVWYYLQHGKDFRPEDIYAGNLLSAIEAIDAGSPRRSTGRTDFRLSDTRTLRSMLLKPSPAVSSWPTAIFRPDPGNGRRRLNFESSTRALRWPR